jgi:hypothetical protein
VSAAALAQVMDLDSPTWAGEASFGEVDSCPSCGHPESVHRLLLTPFGSFVICHEPTESGECFRVRHAGGIPFGACRRDPP